MAYKKFDDPNTTNQNRGERKVNTAEWHESLRRAIQSFANRIVSGTGGTNGTGMLANLGTGGTCGIKLGQTLIACINGQFGTIAAQDNLYLPAGTQAKATYVKYLVAAKFGTNATVVAGNEGTSSTKAYLPDCPDGYVGVGYCEYKANDSYGYIRVGGGTAGGVNILSGKTAGTDGTINAWVNLLHMPLDEA